MTPHLLRDSFATWFASKRVGRYQMCKLMGWSMSSDMPDRYINRIGVVEENAINTISREELGKVERENHELRAALQRLEAQHDEVQRRLERRDKVDAFLTRLLKEEEDLARDLVGRIKARGLGDELMQL